MLAADVVDGGIEGIAQPVEYLHRITDAQTQYAAGVMGGFGRQFAVVILRERRRTIESGG
jgi:hypothetical protein